MPVESAAYKEGGSAWDSYANSSKDGVVLLKSRICPTSSVRLPI